LVLKGSRPGDAPGAAASGQFSPSLEPRPRVLQHLNKVLAAWARRKYKRLRRRRRASAHWLGRIARRNPTLFVLWEIGVLPEAGS